MSSKESAICKTCRKNFLYYRSTLRGKDASFCSRECIKNTAWNKGLRKQRLIKDCLNCNKKFETFKSEDFKFCSQDCVPAHPENLGKYLKGQKGKDNYFFNNKEYSGKKHWNWQGGITPISQKIRNSQEYTIWREAVFLRDNYTCQICNERGGNLNADHIKPFSLYPELRLAIDNGRTLCKSCHLKTDTWGGRIRKEQIYV